MLQMHPILCAHMNTYDTYAYVMGQLPGLHRGSRKADGRQIGADRDEDRSEVMSRLGSMEKPCC